MKKGFIFVETIIVLVVVMVSLIIVYSSFSIILGNAQKKETYDNINDLYKISVIKKMLIPFVIESDYVLIDSTNCTSYMNSDCSDVINGLGIDEIFINNATIGEILNSYPDLSNSLIDFINTLNKNKNYLIIIDRRNSKEYFASLKYDI